MTQSGIAWVRGEKYCVCCFRIEFTIAETKLKEARVKRIKNPEATVLRKSIKDLTPLLAQNLTDIANHLVAKFTISPAEHDMIIYPQKFHTQLCLSTILNTIGMKINDDPHKLYEFVDMLENMDGRYYKELCQALSRCTDHYSFSAFMFTLSINTGGIN